MNLIDKLKNVGKVLSIVGIGLSSGGCIGTPRQMSNFIVKDFLGLKGLPDDTTNVNYVNQQQISAQNNVHSRQSVQEDFNYETKSLFEDLDIVSCNYFQDFNNDHSITYPDEYFGIKDTFNSNEKITLSLLSNKRFREITIELLDCNGKRIERVSHKGLYGIRTVYNLDEVELKEICPNGLPEGMINKLPSGNYRAVWYSEDRLVGVKDFRVVP